MRKEDKPLDPWLRNIVITSSTTLMPTMPGVGVGVGVNSAITVRWAFTKVKNIPAVGEEEITKSDEF